MNDIISANDKRNFSFEVSRAAKIAETSGSSQEVTRDQPAFGRIGVATGEHRSLSFAARRFLDYLRSQLDQLRA